MFAVFYFEKNSGVINSNSTPAPGRTFSHLQQQPAQHNVGKTCFPLFGYLARLLIFFITCGYHKLLKLQLRKC